MSGRRNRRCASLAAAAAAAAGVVATGTAARAAVVSITSAKDNTLYQNATGSISNGAGDSFFAGKTGLGVATRGLLAFDLQGGLPTNALVNSASLTLFAINSRGSQLLSLHAAEKDWGEGASVAVGGGGGGGAGGPAEPGDATWLHTFYDTQFWTSAGGDFAAAASASATLSFGPATFTSSDPLKADVQGWINNPATNFGWVLTGNEALSATAVRIAAREDLDPTHRPQLSIDYSASTWKTAGGNWSAGANWDFGVPNGSGAEANFTAGVGPSVAVTVDGGGKTAGVLNFAGPASYTISGSAVTLNRPGGAPAVINVADGSHLIAAPINVLATSTRLSVAAGSVLTVSGAVTVPVNGVVQKLDGGTIVLNNLRAAALAIEGGTVAIAPSAGPVGVSRINSLTINTGGRFDLGDNKLVTQNAVGSITGGVYDGVSGMIQSGRGTGAWNGATGIVTSQTHATSGSLTGIGVATAAQVKGIAATATTSWAGQTVTGSDTLVMYTYGGDANLDGKINIDDYGHIDTSVGLFNQGWFNGDFNYDGQINIDDYGIIDVNVGVQSLGEFSTGAGAANPVTAVPEPAVLGTLVALVMLRPLRRSRRISAPAWVGRTLLSDTECPTH